MVYAVPSLLQVSIFFCFSPINRDLTEAGEDRSGNDQGSGVVRGMAERLCPGGWMQGESRPE